MRTELSRLACHSQLVEEVVMYTRFSSVVQVVQAQELSCLCGPCSSGIFTVFVFVFELEAIDCLCLCLSVSLLVSLVSVSHLCLFRFQSSHASLGTTLPLFLHFVRECLMQEVISRPYLSVTLLVEVRQ